MESHIKVCLLIKMSIEHIRVGITVVITLLKYIIDLIFPLNWECFNLVINRYAYLKLQR